MEIKDWQQFECGLYRHRKVGTAAGCNLYAFRPEIESWIKARRLEELSFPGSTLFLLREHGFRRVFHAASDPTSLSAALAFLPSDEPLIADLVGRPCDLAALVEAYVSSGFIERRALHRMALLGGAALPARERFGPEDMNVEAAGPEDAEAVHAFLSRLLDIYTEQLPEVNVLRRSAAEGGMLLARKNCDIIGVLLFERQGRNVHLRHWHLEPSARGAGLGSLMMRSFLAENARATRISLWVVADNTESIAIYRHYGFSADGLVDRIMARDGNESPMPSLNPLAKNLA